MAKKAFIDNTKDAREDRALKERWVKRIERDLAGNPLLKKQRPLSFPPLTKKDQERMNKADAYGNLPQKKTKTKKDAPIKRWRWDKKKGEMVEIE